MDSKRYRRAAVVAEVATLRNHSAAQPHRLAWGEAIRKTGLIPHLVRLTTAAVKAAEAAGTLTSLAEAAALQQTTPTEKPPPLRSLYQATQALQEQAASHKPTVPEAAASAAEAAGTLAKLACAESQEGKEAGGGVIHPEQRQILAAVMQPVETPDPGRSLSFVRTPMGGDSAPGRRRWRAQRRPRWPTAAATFSHLPALFHPQAAEAVGCLANMAANSVANQDAVGAAGALPTLVALLGMPSGSRSWSRAGPGLAPGGLTPGGLLPALALSGLVTS